MPDEIEIPICPMVVKVSSTEQGSHGGVLLCTRIEGHEGMHWDPHDDVAWKVGVPDGD